jgi:phosphoribosylformimino-5-aminoimidazole carboxamide ribotide isomerase
MDPRDKPEDDTGMHIIPVIDVRHGLAVRAIAGERASYKPLVTPLAASRDPLVVAAGYRALYPFTTLYVADLDGIEGRGANRALHERIARSWGGEEVWVDDGSVGAAPGSRLARVTGSEALGTIEAWTGPGLRRGDASRAGDILSLDFRGDTFLGPPALLEDASLWPSRVIVMTLARVGLAQGPDLVRIETIARRAGRGCKVYAAGGVRNRADVEAVQVAGAAGALIATALHIGQLRTCDLGEIAES